MGRQYPTWEVIIPASEPHSSNKAVTVEAKNWMAALQAALDGIGQAGPAASNLMLDIKGESIHVTDIRTRRVFEIKQFRAPVDPFAVPASGPPDSRTASTAPAPEQPPSVPASSIATRPERPASDREPSLMSHEVFFSRDEDPTPKNRLSYRERLIAVAPGTSAEDVERILRSYYEQLRATVKGAGRGRYINIAVFDHVFRDRAQRPAIAALDWKDWRGREPVVTFPQRATAVVEPPPVSKADDGREGVSPGTRRDRAPDVHQPLEEQDRERDERLERERMASEERQRMDRQERERKAQKEREREEQQERERKALEERKRKEQVERERKEQKDREREEQKDRERKVLEERKRKGQEERERKAQKERERKEQKERDRKALEERQRKDQHSRNPKESKERERQQQEARERKALEERQRKEQQARDLMESKERERQEQEERERREAQERDRQQQEERERREAQERERQQQEERERREAQERDRQQQEERERREAQERERQQQEERERKPGLERVPTQPRARKKRDSVDFNEVIVDVFEAMQALYSLSSRHECITFAVDLIAGKIRCQTVAGFAKLPTNSSDMFCVEVRGESTKSVAGKNVKIKGSILELAMHEGSAIVVSDARSDSRVELASEHIADENTRSLLCVPFIYEGRNFGAIELLNRIGGDAWREREIHLVTYIGNHLAEYVAQSLPSSDDDFEADFAESVKVKKEPPRPATGPAMKSNVSTSPEKTDVKKSRMKKKK